MLTHDEQMFMTWWEANRSRKKRIRNGWFIGVPTGLSLSLPILLSVFSNWDKHVQLVSRGQMVAIILSILAIVAFFAIFSVQHKWEMREQMYRELSQKKAAGDEGGAVKSSA